MIDSHKYFLFNITKDKLNPCLRLLTAEQILEETAYGHDPDTIKLNNFQMQRVSFIHPHTPVREVYLDMVHKVRSNDPNSLMHAFTQQIVNHK